MMLAVITLAGIFSEALFSSLALFWMHMWKNIPVPVFDEWRMRLLSGISLVMMLWAAGWMTKHPIAVFHSGGQQVKGILSIPFLR